MIEIDGGQKSGSGTIVRTAVALATLLGEELHLWNIRAKRDNPGLRPQHLQAIKACQEICRGEVEGAKVGSREIIYRPGKEIRGGKYQWNIGTAGSTTMLALTILPLACFASAPLSCRVTGGLFQDFAPSAFHTKYLLFPLLYRMGLKAKMEIIRPGYVPEGGGIIQIEAEPAPLGSLVLNSRGKVKGIRGIALSSHLEEARVSHRMA
ncbi:MAG: RNA 3'-terminal phosphate cyclase, partial [Anaerolineae bacterium]|nr:RNA 3'-terminal phosphate cyclase [Anaerolineae bacterium]